MQPYLHDHLQWFGLDSFVKPLLIINNPLIGLEMFCRSPVTVGTSASVKAPVVDKLNRNHLIYNHALSIVSLSTDTASCVLDSNEHL
jgi:hypothetical protein